jgi:hypothetical protein
MELVRSTSLLLRLRPIAQVIVFRLRPISWPPVHQVLARSRLTDPKGSIVLSQQALLEAARTVRNYIDITAVEFVAD